MAFKIKVMFIKFQANLSNSWKESPFPNPENTGTEHHVNCKTMIILALTTSVRSANVTLAY